MDRLNKERIQALFDFALAVPSAQRDVWLVRRCGSDTPLLEAVRELLRAAHDGTDTHPDIAQSAPADPASAPTVASTTQSQRVGPYRIEERIGKGGMGVVYRAFDTRLERRIALKFLPEHLHADQQARERFIAEARAASRLDHPNICAIYDIGNTANGHMYMAMPYYQGETLATRIARGPLPAQVAIDIAIQVADGLAAAHAVDIVHRDIKPANLIITTAGVKILDFGIAKVADVNLTGTGMSVGTLAYMSPEQLRGDKVDARADIWALGATLYEMITGQRAFPGDNLHKTIHDVLYADTDPTASLPDQSLPLRQIIQCALTRDLDERYTSATALLDDLLAARRADTDNATAPVLSTAAASAPAASRGRYEWDASVLDAIANLLTAHLGPIALVLVKRTARQTATVDELAARLAEQLPEETQRAGFRQRFAAEVAVRTTPPAPQALCTDGTLASLELSPLQQAELEDAFTPHIGPIAPVLIKRHAAQATSLAQLCRALAEHLADEAERRAFLDRLGKDYSH